MTTQKDKNLSGLIDMLLEVDPWSVHHLPDGRACTVAAAEEIELLLTELEEPLQVSLVDSSDKVFATLELTEYEYGQLLRIGLTKLLTDSLPKGG